MLFRRDDAEEEENRGGTASRTLRVEDALISGCGRMSPTVKCGSIGFSNIEARDVLVCHFSRLVEVESRIKWVEE